MWLAVKHAETGPVIERLPLPSRHGVTLPHAGTVTKARGGKALWSFGAVGLALVAALLFSNMSPEWLGSLATSFKASLTLL